MHLSEVKPGTSYETYDGDVWLVLSVLCRSPNSVKFTELQLTGEAAGASQEAGFYTDDPQGKLHACWLLVEGA